MPTSNYFSECPAFPSDVPIADIPILSFKKLQNHNDDESRKLYEACCAHGFFLLDLRASNEGEQLLKDAEKMFDLTAETLNLDKEELEKYAYNAPKNLLGYKSAGRLKTEDGNVDAMEMYTIGQDDMLGTVAPRQNPEPLEARRPDCREFFQHAYAAISVVYNHLDKQLGLAPGTLASLCPLDKPSSTSARLLLSHPQQPLSSGLENSSEASTGSLASTSNRRVTLPGHTDIGTITLLFHVAGGLQILPAELDNTPANWRYIKPLPNHALINLGDTMVEWTGGLLRSGLHRVVTAPGPQATATRQSLAYLVRPDQELTMQRLRSENAGSSGVVIPSLEKDEQGETRSVNEWAAWRAMQIMNGIMRPQTSGGLGLRGNPTGKPTAITA
ncbi:MAG: hypothetical protein Q9227_008540 [Pyrenula ochraceoflavens]